jgi:hypothetical protein
VVTGGNAHFAPVKRKLQILFLTRRAFLLSTNSEHEEAPGDGRGFLDGLTSLSGHLWKKPSDPGGRLSESHRFPSQPTVEHPLGLRERTTPRQPTLVLGSNGPKSGRCRSHTGLSPQMVTLCPYRLCG